MKLPLDALAMKLEINNFTQVNCADWEQLLKQEKQSLSVDAFIFIF